MTASRLVAVANRFRLSAVLPVGPCLRGSPPIPEGSAGRARATPRAPVRQSSSRPPSEEELEEESEDEDVEAARSAGGPEEKQRLQWSWYFVDDGRVSPKTSKSLYPTPGMSGHSPARCRRRLPERRRIETAYVPSGTGASSSSIL